MTDRQYFNPDLYRIILYDQRGAGRSRPQAEIKVSTVVNTIDKYVKNQWILQ